MSFEWFLDIMKPATMDLTEREDDAVYDTFQSLSKTAQLRHLEYSRISLKDMSLDLDMISVVMDSRTMQEVFCLSCSTEVIYDAGWESKGAANMK